VATGTPIDFTAPSAAPPTLLSFPFEDAVREADEPERAD
jgi:hypothetical protein